MSALLALGLFLTPALAHAKGPQTESVAGLCAEIRRAVKTFNWTLKDACEGVSWKSSGMSTSGRPLMYAEFGDPKSGNTTLIFSMVHGDEITPLYLALELVQWMRENPEKLKDAHVVIAPLVNPDGFFRKPRTRMNGHGVDVNRNFNTADWHDKALAAWKKKFGSNPRRFPGYEAGSEPETRFQQELIQQLKPQKILSVHAPLNFMDYDGPSALELDRFSHDYVLECLKLRKRLKAISSGYFPGSLGNYSGQQLGIPTLTLELPTANPKMAKKYWERFRPGISTMIEFRVPETSVSAVNR